ncbi:hypothetical protein CCHOA_07850 [Corynebacterium choanae]|uniref:Uncharacterized protein n=1 Tax=Corynebacterium choanae TaxID=1862358 RepID=A0A3G6J828_9CORY|nr:hypothetical protein CCHOA_07850 [Corynebacterium choanae]
MVGMAAGDAGRFTSRMVGSKKTLPGKQFRGEHCYRGVKAPLRDMCARGASREQLQLLRGGSIVQALC